MVMAVRVVSRIPWNSPGGVPEQVVQAPQTSVLTDVAPPVRRADVVVRADGVPEVSTGTVDETVLRPDGRVAVVRYDDARPGRNIVSIDADTGEESVVEAADEAYGFLAGLIGVDKAGRAYGFSGGDLGCVEADGSVAWKVSLRGAAVADDNVTILAGGQLVRSDGKAAHTTADQAILIGQNDQGYVLYRRERGPGYGLLLHLDSQGALTGTEPADADVWVTGTDLRPPRVGSVTPEGEVLMAALSPAGVTVLAFTG
jgi:hypothetical protein